MTRPPPPVIPLATARRAAGWLMDALAENPHVVRMAVTGALRRMEPRVAAVELIVTTLDLAALASGTIEQAVGDLALVHRDPGGFRIKADIPLDLTVMAEDPEAFLAAQLALTASRAHREALEAALAHRAAPQEPSLTEEAWYVDRGLPPLPPELRGSANLDPAPPELVSMGDIQGLFGLHAAPGGGRHPLQTMTDRARREGYRWAVFTLKGSDVATLHALRAEAEAAERAVASAEPDPFRVFLALEAGVTPGGRISVDAALASAADLVLLRPGACADETSRALSDPRVKVLGHPRDDVPWAHDEAAWERVIRSAADHDVALEVSGGALSAWVPDRVNDLAHEYGVPSLPGADALEPRGIDDLLCAAGALRRGRWARQQVLAARGAADFAAWLEGRAE